MNEPLGIRTVDLKGCVQNETKIEFLRAELPPEGSPFAVVRYAVDGDEQELGLRLDLDKGVFLDHFEAEEQKEETITKEIVSYIASATTDKTFSEEELEGWINTHAKYSARIRMARSQAGNVQLNQADIHYAEQALAYDILDGKINFVRRIAPTSYSRLENVWLWEVKCVKAYLIWEERHGGMDPTFEEEDYSRACRHLRNLLIDQAKGTKKEFQEPKSYLKTHYLQSDERIDENKCNELIALKAKRIAEKTGETDQIKNWLNAKTYVEMFYKNIVPAVEDDNRDNVLAVFNAFKFSKAHKHRFLIINCFEAALAIYFLNPGTIKDLWNAGLINENDSL